MVDEICVCCLFCFCFSALAVSPVCLFSVSKNRFFHNLPLFTSINSLLPSLLLFFVSKDKVERECELFSRSHPL